MATAHSSWGPGWPNCQPDMIHKSFGVLVHGGKVEFPGGIRFELVELVYRLVRETVRRGYTFDSDCWGYNCGPISGTGNPSLHSWGLAVDINPTTNKFAGYGEPVVTDMPEWMPELWNEYGFRWGGDVTTNNQGPTHYEFLGSVDDCKAQIEKARANHLGD